MNTAPPGSRERTIVAVAVVLECERRRTQVFTSRCDVRVIENSGKNRVARPHTIKKLEVIPDRVLIPQQEAAVRLGVSLRTLTHLIASGQIEITRIGKRRLVHLRELERFARSDHPFVNTGRNSQTPGQGKRKKPKSELGKKVKPFIEGL